MPSFHTHTTIAADGWTLLSAVERATSTPEHFVIPPESHRSALGVGDAAKLLFDIETRDNGQVIDRGVERMWVIVKSKTSDGFVGVLDNDPGAAGALNLVEGDLISFRAEHVTDIAKPPRDYIVSKYGAGFFGDA